MEPQSPVGSCRSNFFIYTNIALALKVWLMLVEGEAYVACVTGSKLTKHAVKQGNRRMLFIYWN